MSDSELSDKFLSQRLDIYYRDKINFVSETNNNMKLEVNINVGYLRASIEISNSKGYLEILTSR